MKYIAALVLALACATANADTLIIANHGVRHEGILLSINWVGSSASISFTSVETYSFSGSPGFGVVPVVSASMIVNDDTGSSSYSGCMVTSFAYLEPGSSSLTVNCP